MGTRSPQGGRALSLEPIAIKSLVQRLVAEVRGQIISGRLGAGEQLPNESIMAAEFGVSRPLLREALSELRAQGFIETLNGRGSFVRHPSEGDLVVSFVNQLSLESGAINITVDHLYEVRAAIESLCAQLAAQRAEPAEIDVMERLLQSMRDSRHDPAAYTASDVGFHVALARATANPLLPTMLAPIMKMIVEGVFESHGAREAVTQGVAAHERILRAVKRGDSVGARRAMERHLHESRGIFPENVAHR